MINKKYAQDIRICERIKFDQALYILTMYEKKIRKSKKGTVGVVDAEAEMQDIFCSWKSKWKMDLTKPILNCVTSVYPRVLIDLSRQDQQQLTNYYSLINRFLTRLRTQHEDETNFKLVMQGFDRQVNFMTKDKYQASSKAAVKGFLLMAKELTDLQISSIMKNSEIVGDQMLDVNTDSLEWQVWRPLKYIREIATRALYGKDQRNAMDIENDIEPKCEVSQNLIIFCTNVIQIMERIKESEHGSTLITIQPKIDELSLLIHPLLVAINANFKKQNCQKTRDMDWQKIEANSIPMLQNLKGSFNCSKIAFINLDGYQSQFNLQMARNFKNHLMYISFPKEEAKLNDVQQIYSRRFFKKLMFRYSQVLYESYNESSTNEDYRTLTRMERLSYNPEDYHCCTEKLYQTKNDKGGQDFNQNMYIFPVRMSALYQKFPQILQTRQDIQNHESYFIRFIIKDFLLNQIREFNPTMIMISYSGRLHIEDNHFVELMQEFTKISNYKVVLYPNFTSSFVGEEMVQAQDAEGEQFDYDNYVNDVRITSHLRGGIQEDQERNQHWVEMFNKIARFLKVSSGTYNLNRSFEQQPLVGKYKNQFILAYVDQLMTVLGKQFINIDKIRFRNKDLSILPKIFQQSIKNIKKTFQHTVPKLYFDIYDIIEYLLLDREVNKTAKRQKLLAQYSVDIGLYKQLIDNLFDEIANKSNFDFVAVDISRIGQQMNNSKYKKMKQIFFSLKESHLFEISSEKFEQKVNIFFKTNQQIKEYALIVEQTESIKGLFETSFYTNPGKNSVKIYESTKILYRVEQIKRKNSKIPILIMNNLTDGTVQHSFESYYSELDIANSYQENKKTLEEKKCLAVPLTFQGEETKAGKRMYILADWNYHESENYLLLYWPSKYDFMKSFLLKLMNKPYHPQILNEIYICKKGNKNPLFRKVSLTHQMELAARMGTSCYEFEGKIFIFGGFYQKQKNYLQLQHDIVTFDLRAYEQNGQTKLPIQNVKNALYSRQTFDRRLNNRLKSNSFVRPRIQFEFFDRQELLSENQTINDEDIKTVIMFGGYGQNFLRPYSLLTYYYYILQFRRNSRMLENVEKRIIYNKAIPVNTREMTKNLGVIKTNKKLKNGIIEPNKLTDPDAYAVYRNTFKIDINNNTGQQEFNYKFKYMFSEDESKTFKQEIKKIQELRAEEFDASSITIERDSKNNHRIALEKDGKKKWVALRLELSVEKSKKIEGNPSQVNLTHESIIYIDIWNSMICAIVKHEKYTHGKSILVEYNTKKLEGLNFEQDSPQYLTMAQVKQFDYDLTLHILIICNKNTMAILHGEKLGTKDTLKEFIVKRKKTKNDIVACQIKQRELIIRKNEQSSLINTVFFRNRNKIMSIDFIALGDTFQFYISSQQIQLNITNDNYRWTNSTIEKYDSTMKYQFCFAEKNFVRMEQLRFVQFLKGQNENYLIVEFNRKRFVCEVSKSNNVLQLLQENSVKLQANTMERGILLLKTEDNYNDRDFF